MPKEKKLTTAKKTKRVATTKKRSVKRAPKSAVAKAVVAEEIIIPEVTQLSAAIEPAQGLQTSTPEVFEVDESVEENIQSQWIQPAPVDPVARAKQRTMLWAGVGTTMALIVIGWAMTLPAVFSGPIPPADPALQNSTEQFNNLFSDISQRLDEFRATAANVPANTPVNTPANAPAAVNEPATSPDVMTPEQIQLLKQKVLGTETESKP